MQSNSTNIGANETTWGAFYEFIQTGIICLLIASCKCEHDFRKELFIHTKKNPRNMVHIYMEYLIFSKKPVRYSVLYRSASEASMYIFMPT